MKIDVLHMRKRGYSLTACGLRTSRVMSMPVRNDGSWGGLESAADCPVCDEVHRRWSGTKPASDVRQRQVGEGE